MGQQEAIHVEFIETALRAAGVQPVQACEYDFKFTDAASMVGTAGVLEAVGVSA